jgi:hypothetical protein
MQLAISGSRADCSYWDRVNKWFLPTATASPGTIRILRKWRQCWLNKDLLGLKWTLCLFKNLNPETIYKRFNFGGIFEQVNMFHYEKICDTTKEEPVKKSRPIPQKRTPIRQKQAKYAIHCRSACLFVHFLIIQPACHPGQCSGDSAQCGGHRLGGTGRTVLYDLILTVFEAILLLQSDSSHPLFLSQ